MTKPEVAQEYKVSITSGNTRIESWLAEDLEFTISSDWEEPFKDLLNSLPSAAQAGAALLAPAVGASLYTKAGTTRTWSGSSPLSLSLALSFFAYENALQEVVAQVARLQAMAAPGLGAAGTFVPPGPPPIGTLLKSIPGIGESLSAAFGIGGEHISLHIGDGFFTLHDIIVKEVQARFVNKMSRKKSGNPSRPLVATANVTIESAQTLTKGEILALYQLSGGRG